MKSKIIENLKKLQSPHRFEHTLRVRDMALELAKIHGEDLERMELVALLHDYAKGNEEKFIEEYGEILCDLYFIGDDLNNPHLVHGPLSALIAMREYEIFDEELQDAIAFHSTGFLGMTNFSKVLYLADKIELARDYDGVQEIREYSKTNLDLAMLKSLDRSIYHLLKENQPISIHTIKLRNKLIEKGV